MKWILVFLCIGVASCTMLFTNKVVPLSAPLKVIYIDYKDINYNLPQDTLYNASAAGFNVLIMGFYLTYGPADQAQNWAMVTQATQQATMQYLHSQGVVVLISFGGGTEYSAYTSDPTSLGTQVKISRFFLIRRWLNGLWLTIWTGLTSIWKTWVLGLKELE